MDKIRIQNLRALKDTGYIELKPLTILVGKNSSGKSTLLRFFPLMKQTLETRTNEPILWYSPAFVDFGSFEESLNHESKEKLITFEFNFKASRELIYRELSLFVFRSKKFKSNFENDEEIKIELKITFSKTEINKIEVLLWDHKIEYFYKDINKETESVEILINGKSIKKRQLFSRYFGNSTNMLQRVYIDEGKNIVPIEGYFRNELYSLITGKENDLSSIEDSDIDEIISSIELGDSKTIIKSLEKILYTSNSSEKRIGAFALNQSEFIEIKDSYLGMLLNGIADVCNNGLKSFFSSVKYIAPIRASAERYYRIQGLALDEIDPQGANIHMILSNMNNGNKKSFNKWIKENFGFEIIADSTGGSGHTSLYIRYENGTKINLADTGFGYSQILPIILVLWKAVQTGAELARFKNLNISINDLGRNKSYTIVIEQPELHLHPSLQAILIDTFAKIIKVSKEIGIDLKIIIETHSETMINRIGQLIATNFEGFNEELVNVLIFNSSNPYISNIKSTGYTEDGFLTSWPIGFFSPEEI
ncbi:AAA family ATPase [Bacillus toyonensis]|uniref:AAA family ATPase n=1 Tax=Bacillus toyonensis TaxID=155322 RepID=UPI001481E784|nr:AAA family ATPase [Bacillus toyonensis]